MSTTLWQLLLAAIWSIKNIKGVFANSLKLAPSPFQQHTRALQKEGFFPSFLKAFSPGGAFSILKRSSRPTNAFCCLIITTCTHFLLKCRKIWKRNQENNYFNAILNIHWVTPMLVRYSTDVYWLFSVLGLSGYSFLSEPLAFLCWVIVRNSRMTGQQGVFPPIHMHEYICAACHVNSKSFLSPEI